MEKSINQGKAIKKPIAVSFIQFTSADSETMWRICDFVRGSTLIDFENQKVHLATLEDRMWVSIGDYIVKGVAGECYTVNKDIFESTYDVIN